jgi:hypothetical protein
MVLRLLPWIINVGGKLAVFLDVRAFFVVFGVGDISVAAVVAVVVVLSDLFLLEEELLLAVEHFTFRVFVYFSSSIVLYVSIDQC